MRPGDCDLCTALIRTLDGACGMHDQLTGHHTQLPLLLREWQILAVEIWNSVQHRQFGQRVASLHPVVKPSLEDASVHIPILNVVFVALARDDHHIILLRNRDGRAYRTEAVLNHVPLELPLPLQQLLLKNLCSGQQLSSRQPASRRHSAARQCMQACHAMGH
jgi:hypothetical protein